jgi:hypothetical protein
MKTVCGTYDGLKAERRLSLNNKGIIVIRLHGQLHEIFFLIHITDMKSNMWGEREL